ncbi:MAG: class I SAM-dependent methyltransferase [Promethearchaeota archaeon]
MKNLKRIIKLIITEPKFEILFKYALGKKVKILDVGCGNHSAQRTKEFLPICKYFGIDKTKHYYNSPKDFQIMDKFWLIDLENSELKEIPNNFFDIIILSHTLEHLVNGLEVLMRLIKKLKVNGIIYIEFPSTHTCLLPSLKRYNITFNFFDDYSHKKIISKQKILNNLLKHNFIIKSAKIYFNWKRIIFLPFSMAYQFKITRFKCLQQLWYLVGWCTYILAIKN